MMTNDEFEAGLTDPNPVEKEHPVGSRYMADSALRGRKGFVSMLAVGAAVVLVAIAMISVLNQSPSDAELADSTGQDDTACEVEGDTLTSAREAYSEQCTQPRLDCDPIDGAWLCSSQQIGSSRPGGSDPVPPTPVTPDPTPTTTPDPTTPDPDPTTTTMPPTPVAGNACIAVEAESLPLTGAWSQKSDDGASGGSYIVWEGLSKERNNSSPADIMSVDIDVTQPGTYRFVWAMRQPSDVEGDKANDSWLNFPDADRFGPVSGGSYNDFVKVYGRGTGDFAWAGTADVNHVHSSMAIQFDNAGTYTMQIAGRSHGHQIDKIVLHHDSVSKDDAIAGNCGDGDPVPDPDPTPAPDPTPDPEPNPDPPVTDGPFDASTDLISLQYDHAPDRDDGHATVAGRVVTEALGIDPWVIGGAYGENKNTYDDDSEPVMNATWGNDWVNADADWDQAVDRTADRWQETLNNGGDVWVAEGGQSDITADVVRELSQRMSDLDTKQRIHLVQHSNWNEDHTTDADLAYVRENTDYIKLADGNHNNDTANLNQKDGQFVTAARASQWGTAWDAAFGYLNPDNRLDFSDTVELLHIVGIDKDEVATPADFADRFLG